MLFRSITLELVSFNLDTAQVQEVMEWLDEVGTNPFRYGTSYKSIDELVNAKMNAVSRSRYGGGLQQNMTWDALDTLLKTNVAPK